MCNVILEIGQEGQLAPPLQMEETSPFILMEHKYSQLNLRLTTWPVGLEGLKYFRHISLY